MKIVGTNDLSYNIERLFKECKDYLVLVSPYIRLHHRLKAILKELDTKKNIYSFSLSRI